MLYQHTLILTFSILYVNNLKSKKILLNKILIGIIAKDSSKYFHLFLGGDLVSNSLVYWVWLSSIPALGSVRGRKLLDYFGTPEEIWRASKQSLQKVPELGPILVDRLLDETLRSNAQKHMSYMAKNNIDAIVLNDISYPTLLKEIYDPPLVLFKRGRLEVNKCVAVVGSRKASDYGLKVAKELAYGLARNGINVVSGLARGIDSKAHEGAIDASGITTAVLGCGVDVIYPPENERLFNKILSSGALVSEYLPGFPPLPGNFPARNRIISGLCSGVIVIEANEKSGSLITANFALEQGRDVFAIPGNLGNMNSKGTNKLIREGAKLVTCVDDILEEINFFDLENKVIKHKLKEKAPKSVSISIDNLEDDEKKIVTSLLIEELHIDELSKKTGLEMKTLNSLLIMLELAGYVEQRAGKFFSLKTI